MHFSVKLFEQRKVFLTGGSGFIGKNIIKYLIDNDIQPSKLTLLSRTPQLFISQHPELQAPWLELKAGNILDLTWNNENYDYFIHAATSVVDPPQALTLFDEILAGTRKALEFALLAKVAIFVNFSSGAVYQIPDQLHKLSEESAVLSQVTSQKSTYGLAKLASEHLVYLYSEQFKLKAVSLRGFCFAGPYLNSKHFAIGEFVRKAICHQPIEVIASNSIYRSYLAVEDLVQQLFRLLQFHLTTASYYATYNLGSDQAISLPELAKYAVAVLSSQSTVTCPNYAKTGVAYYVPNINKIISVAGPPQYTLEQIIYRLAAYYANH